MIRVSATAILSLALIGLAVGQTSSLQERFERVDRNGDGKVTPQELPRPRLFEQLDRNGDGVISLVEVSGRSRGRAGGNTVQSKVTQKSDLAYGPLAAQKLDLYFADQPTSAPIMIYIHGGGWRKGDKAAVGQKVEFFTDMGWIFISANYRLIPGGEHPKNVEDVASAIAWAHQHAAEYGGDPERIFIMGHSAGCHLVSLVATDERHLEKAGGSLGIVKGVIALDTQAYSLPELLAETPSALYAEVFGKDPAVHHDASPMHHVAKDKDIPPFLICYSSGMGGRANPKRSVCANAFRDALRAAGVRAEVIDASDRNHGQINQRFGNPDDEKVTIRAKAFLEDALR